MPPAPPPAALAQQLRSAAQLLQQGQGAAAATLLSSVAKEFPHNSEAHYLLGVSASLIGDAEAALVSLQQALKLNRGNAAIHQQTGMVLDGLGRHAEAATRYRDAIRLDPKLPEAHYNLGLALQHMGDVDGAARSYQNALAQRPQFVEALNNLGNVLLAKGQLDGALRALQAAIAARPSFHVPYNNLGNTLAKLKRRDAAIDAFRKALSLQPNFAEALGNLAEQLLHAGQSTEAKTHYERLLQLQPDNADARFALAALNAENPPAPPDSFVRKVFDDLAPTFDEHLVNTLGYGIPKLLIATLQPWLDARPPVSVVDMGCGTGLFGLEVKPWCRHLAGSDLSSAMVAQCQKRGVYDSVQQCELLEHLNGLADASVDLLTATDVFVYVGDLTRIFAAATRVLAPRGRFAFSIEALAEGEFKLQASSRYAQSAAYIQRLSREQNLRIIEQIDTPIRNEQGKPIAGFLFVLERP